MTGAYSGAGKLLSKSAMTIGADSVDLDAGAEVRSGGDGTFTVAGALNNAGALTASGNLSVRTSSVRNLGTLGASGTVAIESASIRNERGLLFSGSNMQLLTDSLTNLFGDLYSLGWLSVAKDQAGTFASLIENRSGSIESAGDMSLRATALINRKEQFETKKTQTAGSVSVVCYDCGGDHHNVDYVATETFDVVVDPDKDSAAARIIAVAIWTCRLARSLNRFSTVSASGDIDIAAATLENTGAATGTSQRVRRFNSGRVTDGTDERFRDAYVYPYNAQPLPKELPSAYSRWNLVSDIETQDSTGSGAPAIIQAGGNVDIQAAQSITSASVLDSQAPQAGSDKTESTQVNGSGQPLVVTLNAQSPADPRQQAVDPLDLPGFTLPQGQHGLFQVNTNPGHPYLIETNPALTKPQAVPQQQLLAGQARLRQRGQLEAPG